MAKVVEGEAVSLFSLNVGWTTKSAGRRRQVQEIEAALEALGGGPALLALQEVYKADVERFEAAGWVRLVGTERPKPPGQLGVAVMATADVVADDRPIRIEPGRFMRGEMYEALAEWYSARAVAVDVVVGSSPLRFGSFHATPGSSAGPKQGGVGGKRKPWFHRVVAEWIRDEWPEPWAFAIDANSPHSETLEDVRYFVQRGAKCDAGEDDLLGIASLGYQPLHQGSDLLRTWLDSPKGVGRRAEITEQAEGPLWISHFTRGGKAKRFDHLWASPGVVPEEVTYSPISWPPTSDAISDHSLVAARLRLPVG